MGERADWTEAVQRFATAKKPGKYRSEPVQVEGIRFDSKLEADRYRELKLLRQSGEVLYFLRQVPFDAATRVVYRADFLVVWNRMGTAGENVTVEDCKGFVTPTARVKIAAVQDRYGIKIQILTRKEVRRA